MEIPLITTTDIGLATALLTIGFSIDGTDPQDRRRVVFYFKKTPELDKAINAYWQRKLAVEPRGYEESRLEILRKIHEYQGNQKLEQN